ncbi:cytochrome c-555 precursor [mine drainage metagenome]|uniref:Cytochrome c-555 n=1 Tax=mine drainage metagenome TaxID=410659 RepID=A0A1J5RVF3_9ZZZZ
MSAHQPKPSNESGDLPFAPTLRKTILILLIGFATPIIILLLIVHFISDETVPPAGSASLSTAAVNERIAPVGQVAVASSAQAASQANAASMSSAAPAASASGPAAGGASAAAATGGAAMVASADAGKKLYESTCIACHGTGVAGAPKVGDKAAWGPIIAQGMPVLYDRAIHGFTGKLGTMPPKGGSAASDADVKAAVDYMVAQSK